MMNKKIKQLLVSTPQGMSGVLHRDSRFSFNYTSGDRSVEVSMLMPIRPASYSSGVLPIPFLMNKPEGFLLQKITDSLAKLGGMDDMKLLSLVGDNQIGRIRYKDPTKVDDKLMRPKIGLKELLANNPTQSLFDSLVDTYLGSGVSGVQPKVLLPDADMHLDYRATVVHSNLIVKSGGDDFPFLTQNEFLCMDAARQSKIDTPDFWLSENGGLFIMDRFDLQEGRSIGFEDMSVLMGKQPDVQGVYKYQGSYENIATAIQLYCRENSISSAQKLFEYVALSVMVQNGDAHLKNFGLLYDYPTSENAPKLSPLYDVVTTSIYPHYNSRTGLAKYDTNMALKLNKDKAYPLRKTLLKFGSDICHVANPGIILDNIASGMSASLVKNKDRIDADFFNLMQAAWDKGRLSVEPNRFYLGSLSSSPAALMVNDLKIAEEIAMEKGDFSMADLSVDNHYSGTVMGLTDGHVVMSLGRVAMIFELSGLDKTPQAKQEISISVKNHVGVVSEIVKDKGRGVSR